MSEPMIWAGLAVISLAFLYLVIIRPAQFARVHVSCNDGAIAKMSRGKTTSINIADISEVKYHYSAVVGAFYVWEFLDKTGESFQIDSDATGKDDVLPFLESTLPGFSVNEFEEKMRVGDVEDTIDVWKRS